MRELKSVSIYVLLVELFSDGDLGILPEIEPIPEKDIINELTERSGQSHRTDKRAWANWFLFETEVGSELEKESFLNMLADMEFPLA